MAMEFWETEEFKKQIAEEEAYHSALGEAMQADAERDAAMLDAAKDIPSCDCEPPCGKCQECLEAEMERGLEPWF